MTDRGHRWPAANPDQQNDVVVSGPGKTCPQVKDYAKCGMRAN